jgi:hypothetical protein
MASLDIIELIENNPISKLTNTYNVKLLNKIKANFSETEQQLFIGTFYCYLNYDTKKDFVVDLDNVWKWMGFSQKIRAKEVLDRHFLHNVDYKYIESAFSIEKAIINNVLSEEKVNVDKSIRGGHNIKKVMMTIKCFKSLCLKSQTKKASEIHEYYMKMEEMLHEVIEEEGTELKKQMEEQKYIMDQQAEKQKQLIAQQAEELKISPELEKHRVLLHQYGNIIGSIVYIVRIKQCEQGKYIIKIGESRKGIKNRFNEFKQKYGSQILILDCFSVHDSAGFEKFLHHHSEIHPHKVKNLKGHETEHELFMMGNELTYQRLIQIIEAGITTFNNPIIENERLKLEIEQLRSQTLTQYPSTQIDHNILQEILKTNQILLHKIQNLEVANKDIISRLNSMQTKTTTVYSQHDPHIGPRLQKIHPELLTLLHTYETVTECMKENNLLKRPSINKAVQENTVYHGFRWQLVNRELNPNIIHSINPTKITKVQKNGYIAKVNKEQTEILNIYLDRKTAARYNDYPCISSLDNVVKHHTLKDDHYYQLYKECEVVLQNKWKEKHNNIILYHDGIGQFDVNKILIAEFASRYDCTVKTGISQKSLAKVLDNDIQYKNSYFKSIGEKLFI